MTFGGFTLAIAASLSTVGSAILACSAQTLWPQVGNQKQNLHMVLSVHIRSPGLKGMKEHDLQALVTMRGTSEDSLVSLFFLPLEASRSLTAAGVMTLVLHPLRDLRLQQGLCWPWRNDPELGHILHHPNPLYPKPHIFLLGRTHPGVEGISKISRGSRFIDGESRPIEIFESLWNSPGHILPDQHPNCRRES